MVQDEGRVAAVHAQDAQLPEPPFHGFKQILPRAKVFAIPFALTTGGPGTSTEVFSSTDYLTTIQFFDFGKGSAMGIIFLIMVSAIITLFFRQMRRSLA